MAQPRSFGQWVQQCRKALDLTQAALAQQVGFSASASMSSANTSMWQSVWKAWPALPVDQVIAEVLTITDI